MAWFIVVWEIGRANLIGPYPTEEAAIRVAKEMKEEEGLEHVGLVGPLPFNEV